MRLVVIMVLASLLCACGQVGSMQHTNKSQDNAWGVQGLEALS